MRVHVHRCRLSARAREQRAPKQGLLPPLPPKSRPPQINILVVFGEGASVDLGSRLGLFLGFFARSLGRGVRGEGEEEILIYTFLPSGTGLANFTRRILLLAS